MRRINAMTKSWLTLAISAATNGASNETLWRRLNANDITTSAAAETNFFGVENSFKFCFFQHARNSENLKVRLRQQIANDKLMLL